MAERWSERADRVRDAVEAMGRGVEARLQRTLKALRALEVESAEKAVADDARTDDEEVGVERGCLDLLARFRPSEADLRWVTAVVKINSDLERIGDLAANIAQRVGPLAHLGGGPGPDQVAEIGRIACEMLTDVMDAFVRRDTVLAERVRVRDDTVDVLNEELYRALVEEIAEDSRRLEFAMHYLAISKTLERVADHCTNIAEDVIFMVTGEIVRHRGRA